MALTALEKQSLVNLIAATSSTAQTHWENFSQNISLNNVLIINVENENHLQKIIRLIHVFNSTKSLQEKISVRVAAGGKANDKGGPKAYSDSYTLSPQIICDVVIRLVGAEFQNIKAGSGANCVNIGAAIEIGDLDKALYYDHQLSLPTSSLIPYVTFGGLTANAGHGTGRDQPGVAGLIKKMRILRPDGEFVELQEGDAEFATIRAAHLGMFGIVTRLEVQCIPARKLESTVLNRNLVELNDEIQNGLFAQNDYVSIMYVPTYQKDEANIEPRNNITIIKNRPVNLSVSTTPNHTPKLRHIGQELSIQLGSASHTGQLLARFPQLTVPYMKYVVSKVEIEDSDSLRVGPWHEMAHYQESFPRALDDIDYEFAVDAKATQLITVFDVMKNKLAEYAERGEYPVVYAAYVRFYRGTQGGLSTSSHGNDHFTCAVDIVSDPNIPSWPAFKKEMEKFFIQQMNARPHWGKAQPDNYDYEHHYGQGYQDFKNTLATWLARCNLTLDSNPFNNDFFRKVLKLENAPAQVKAAEFVVTKSTDEDMHRTAQACLTYSKANDDISEVNPHTLNWIKELEKVKAGIETKQYNNNRLFPAATPKPNTEEAAPKQKSPACCVLM